MTQIYFEHVTKKFDKVVALNDLSLEVNKGEFLTLVGPSGCGKTTTLNLLAGLEVPTDGRIYVDDLVINHVPAGNRDMAMVFQSYALYPHMTVFDNMAFALRIRRKSKEEIKHRVLEAARLLSIEDLLARKPSQLSGGQRQRVALGRALVRNPKAFLLDEPLSNLDAILRIQMRAELRLLFKRLGATVVYVTHDQAEAMTMSDRLVVFNRGHVQQIGTPVEIYEQPTNTFVAGFIGSPPMNFFRCRFEVREDLLVLQGDGIQAQIPAGSVQIPQEKEIIVGVRPEDLIISNPNCDAVGSTTGQVMVVEYLGSEKLYYVRFGEKLIVIKTGIKENQEVSMNDQIRYAPKPGSIHLFHPVTETNLGVERS